MAVNVDPSRHEAQKVRLERLIDSVQGLLNPTTIDLAREMVDANESPVALQMIGDTLAEASTEVPALVFAEFADLAAGLDLDPSVTERLRGRVDGNR